MRSTRCGISAGVIVSVLLLLAVAAREVLSRALLALGLELAVGDQLADRQREVLRGRTQLLVDLLDAQTRVLRDERVEAVHHVVELVRRALRTTATAAGSPQDGEASTLGARRLAQRFIDHVPGGSA